MTCFFQSQSLIRNWIECPKSSNIGSLWNATRVNTQNELSLHLYELLKACTVNSNDKKINPVDAPLLMPLSKLKDDTTVWFLVKDIETEVDNNTHCRERLEVNAFNLLMEKKKTTLPLKNVTNKKDELYNDLLGIPTELKLYHT